MFATTERVNEGSDPSFASAGFSDNQNGIGSGCQSFRCVERLVHGGRPRDDAVPVAVELKLPLKKIDLFA
jgi:hypothetical protein